MWKTAHTAVCLDGKMPALSGAVLFLIWSSVTTTFTTVHATTGRQMAPTRRPCAPLRVWLLIRRATSMLPTLSPIAGLSASTVFGQSNFTDSGCSTDTIDGLCFPKGVAVDTSGNLYLADWSNNRVLEYNTPLQVTDLPGSGDTVPDLMFGGPSAP